MKLVLFLLEQVPENLINLDSAEAVRKAVRWKSGRRGLALAPILVVGKLPSLPGPQSSQLSNESICRGPGQQKATGKGHSLCLLKHGQN